MAYLNQPTMSNRKLTALVIAGLVHVALGYALVTGLALEVAKKVFTPIEAVNIEEEVPEEPPPPPEEIEDIPVVTPPPDVAIDLPPPPQAIQTETQIIRPTPPPVILPPPAPTISAPAPPPAPPPPAPSVAKKAEPRLNLKTAITTDDYPSASQRAEEEGTVMAAYVIDTQGRVSDCTVTRSSGHPRLDEVTCTLIKRRFRFRPAQDAQGKPIEDKGAQPVRWQIPR